MPNERNFISRREAIGRIVGLAATAVVAASGLSGCLSSARRDIDGDGSRADGPSPDVMRIGCTGCMACHPCRFDVDIAGCFAAYNAAVQADALPDPRRQSPTVYRRLRRKFLERYNGGLDQFARADRCVGCHECEPRCPQRLDIVAQLRRVESLAERLVHDELLDL